MWIDQWGIFHNHPHNIPQVPVWIDQWGIFATAGTGDADRGAYLRDVLAVFGEAQLHWAMWIWRRCGRDLLYCRDLVDLVDLAEVRFASMSKCKYKGSSRGRVSVSTKGVSISVSTKGVPEGE